MELTFIYISTSFGYVWLLGADTSTLIIFVSFAAIEYGDTGGVTSHQSAVPKKPVEISILSSSLPLFLIEKLKWIVSPGSRDFLDASSVDSASSYTGGT